MRKDRFFLLASVVLFVSCASSPLKTMSPNSPKFEKFEYTIRGRGKPVVVFESGLGEKMETWRSISMSLSPFSKVLVYNRLGCNIEQEAGPEEGALDLGLEALERVVPGAQYAGLALEILKKSAARRLQQNPAQAARSSQILKTCNMSVGKRRNNNGFSIQFWLTSDPQSFTSTS